MRQLRQTALIFWVATRVWLFERYPATGHRLSDGTLVCFGPEDFAMLDRIDDPGFKKTLEGARAFFHAQDPASSRPDLVSEAASTNLWVL